MINLHTHTIRCGHATGTDRDYIEAALQAGFTEIGFSDHAPIILKDDLYDFDFAKAKDYFASVKALREEYKDRIRIHIGFEVEYHPGYWDQTVSWFEDLGCEYVLLGQHMARYENGRGFYPATKSDSVYALDYYIDCCMAALNTGKVTYLAHPDLMNFTGDPDVYLNRFEKLIDEMNRLKIAGEYNRLGFYEHRNYPNDVFWKLAAEKKMKTVIGLDAHQPEVYLDTDTPVRMEETLNALGIQVSEPEVRLW